jgi:potassium voltage-gated channel Eag-related subfamily H protein 8
MIIRKATKKIKQVKKPFPPLRTPQGTWARSNVEKTHAFAEHLAKVFQPHPSENEPKEQALIQLFETLYQLKPPPNHLKRAEVQEANSIKPKKSSGYDLITGKILKELPIIGIKYLTQLFSAVLLTGYFPAQWKVVQMILILKPGKPNELTSYQPISILPIVSKVLEKLLKRLLPIVEINRLISNHQFGFRQRHSTIEHTHRAVRKINEALEIK